MADSASQSIDSAIVDAAIRWKIKLHYCADDAGTEARVAAWRQAHPQHEAA